MAFDFPNSPTIGQTYGNYLWDGEKWTATVSTKEVLEYANLAAFPATGVPATIYVAQDTNNIYRWAPVVTAYVELSPSVAGKWG